ncbi:hypothetical protein [Trichormus azollae]|uniref:hypothetical protein n=1 Tax=Trichormus azollae TaxID=1164 RepID=UPI00325E802F
MEIWRYGDMEIWRYGDMEIWRYGDMEIWRYGDMEIWRYGDMDGNPLFFTNFQYIITYIEVNKLNQLLEKGILGLSSDNKYKFGDSKV